MLSSVIRGSALLRALSFASFLVFAASCGDGTDSSQSELKGSVASGRYSLISAHSGKCLDVPNANFANGVQLQQWDCNGTAAQTFRLQPSTNGGYEILSENGLALDVRDKSLADGAAIQLWGINKEANQRFRFEASGNAFFIRNESSGRVIDIDRISADNGAVAHQWSATGADNQRWILAPADQSPKTFAITNGNHVYFKGGDNQRDKRFNVSLPNNFDAYNRGILHLKLSCPSGRCDAWDRMGSFGVYSKAHGNRFLELLRFMTPYGQGGSWDLDVTDLLPLFAGQQDFRIFIDTWVGPGSSSGNGWLVDLSLTVTPGPSALKTRLIVPVLAMADIAYGDPKSPTARKQPIAPLLGYKSAKIYSIITGHGQGNGQNCAEFCAKTHSLTIGSQTFSQKIWRDDCATTTSQTQGGNSRSSRAGWCPGDIVRPWTADVTAAVETTKGEARYDVEAYENSCRPDSSSCSGCVFGTSCAYDGGLHTDPKYYVTSYVIYKN